MKLTRGGLLTAPVLAVALAACSMPSSTTSAPADSAEAQKVDQALQRLQGKVFSKGPNGEKPADASAANQLKIRMPKGCFI